MSDASVADALRSSARSVLVEAPAGTGKTYQAASYARHAVDELRKGQRLLILAHTHAACGVFSSRTHDLGTRVNVGTIDSLIAAIAKAYHRALSLPADINAWSIELGDASYSELARKVRLLLERSPMVGSAIVERHPIVVCDEHQDASADQHAVVAALHLAGARLRFFGDPMQTIFASGPERQALVRQWQALADVADEVEQLDTPHRWTHGSPSLGAWVLRQRERLRAGEPVDLRGKLPRGLKVLRADNQADRHGGYQLGLQDRRPISSLVQDSASVLVLTPHNAMVRGLNGFFGWRVPIWEGHTREALSDLLASCRRDAGNAVAIGQAFCTFLGTVGKGFSASAYGDRLIKELQSQCAKPARGKPAEIQEIARLILTDPSHLGVGAALEHVHHLMHTSQNFSDIRIDLRREFAEARRVHAHADLTTVLAMQAHQRGTRRAEMPPKVISTIHKSKGLETRNAILIPCEAANLKANDRDRCLLYVALSRASETLTVVVPRVNPSPLAWV